MADDQVSLTMLLHSGLEVIKSQQREIDRRVAAIERKIEERLIDPRRVEAMETYIKETQEGDGWKAYLWQAIDWVVGVTIAVTVLKFFGVEAVF